MRIEKVTTHILDHQLDQVFESAATRFDRRQHILVSITCDDGTTGWGECLGPARANAAIVNTYSNWLIGANPLETEKCWATLYHALRDQGQRGLAITALSGIDIALWDIKGKALGMPISALLGGRFRDSVKAYATGCFRKPGLDRVSDIASEAKTYEQQGFDAIKIKIGFSVEEDLAVIAALRETLEPATRLMVDANHGYTTAEAIRFGRAAEKFDLDWFEEPVLPEQLAAYRRVRQGQPIAVAGGETWHGRWAMREAIRSDGIDILQPDICGCGGFSEIRRIADLAAMDGIRVVPHVWGTAVQIAASLQWLAAMIPDPMRDDPIAPILEFDRTPNPFRQAIITEPLEHQNGVVRIPDAPGLGITVNQQALQQYTLQDEA